jgi:hypothetical protein
LDREPPRPAYNLDACFAPDNGKGISYPARRYSCFKLILKVTLTVTGIYTVIGIDPGLESHSRHSQKSYFDNPPIYSGMY